MKKKIIKITAFLLFTACTAVFAMVAYFDCMYPSTIHTASSGNVRINSICTAKKVSTVEQASAKKSNSYESVIKLFGVIPIKNVSVSVAEHDEVVMCGTPFGVMLYSRGVMVVDSADFRSASGLVNPAKQAGLTVGDILISLNGEHVTSTEDVTRIVASSNGEPVVALYERNNSECECTIYPQKCADDNAYKIGLWVRDSSAGIGTLTFYDVNSGVAVGFGHGICDADTGQIISISHGTAVSASLYGIKKGAAGNPGELLGTLNIFGTLGKVILNDQTGVYIDTKYAPKGVALPVAHWQEVKKGDAEVYLSVDGEQPQYYSVRLDDINANGKTKNFTVTVTDPRLKERTGGIVQGMSGSPIVQGGKLVGAVTHVLINNSTKGYGIFAENMLETANGLTDRATSEAS